MKNLSSRFPDRERITLLAVSPNADDHATLNQLLSGDSLEVSAAGSRREAESFLRRQKPSVVLCEKDLPDGSWRDLMNTVLEMDQAPPMIVISRHADERLWAEVLNLGGYDVLAKPLERVEVRRVLGMACRYKGQAHALTA